MRIARLETTDGARHAIWTGDAWAVVEDGFADPPIRTGVTVEADDARLLAPCEPQVLVGIAHNKTNNNHPLPIQAWHKSVRTIVGPGDAIHARRDVGTINIEGELAVVIGRDTEGLALDTAFDYVFGYTVVNDVTNVDRNAVDEKISRARAATATRHWAPGSRPSSTTRRTWPPPSASTERWRRGPAASTSPRPSRKASSTSLRGFLSVPGM